MDIDLFIVLLAVGGGLFGAAVGALLAFVFTGLLVLLATVGLFGDPDATFLAEFAFGGAFGPHVSFAGGVAAAAYAGRRGLIDGKDIVTPLAKLARPDVLLVGAAFGVVGYVIEQAVGLIPWFGAHTDTVAVTVIVSALLARVLLARGPVVARQPGKTGWAAFAPTDGGRWIQGQERMGPNTVLGLGAGALAAGMTIILSETYPSVAAPATAMFGISAISLAFLTFGLAVPVTHHITLVAGVSALTFLPVVGGNRVAALLIGCLGGMCAAWVAELFARLTYNYGNTHFDPPAAAIWPMTTIVLGVGSAL